MTGTISRVQDEGTIVVVWADTTDGLGFRSLPIHFDHRMFWNMVEARGANRILGHEIEFESALDAYLFGGQSIRFTDEE